MEKFKSLLKKLLFPPVPILCLVAVASFSLLILVFVYEYTENAAAYIIYVLSAYSLTACTFTGIKLSKSIKASVKDIRSNSKLIKKAEASRIGQKLLTDAGFRKSFGIYQGLTANLLYMLFRVFTAIRYASVWFISIAAYYLFLSLLKAYIILCFRKAEKKSDRLVYEYTCFGRLGIFLFFLNVPMGGMILQMIVKNSGYSYPGVIIYASAAYTFYMFVISVINLFKARRSDSPVLTSARVLNFVAAMMSLLGLQTAMISQFSQNDDRYRLMMNSITGTFVFTSVTAIAIFMIVYSVRKRNRLTE